MKKEGAHLRSVKAPGEAQVPVQGKREDVFMTDFGFNKPEHQKGQAASQPRTGLDNAYEFWQRNQSAANLSQLLETASPVLDKAITSLAGGDRTLRGRAKRLAIDAFRSFDPAKGAKLRTHLMIRLQPLQREYTKRTSSLAIPERVQLDQLRLTQAEQSLSDELGRDPSDHELAEFMGLSQKRIAHVRKFVRGLLAEGQIRSDEGEQRMPAAEEVTAADIWVEYVHHDLDSIDKKIFEWKTGYNGKKIRSNNEIAKRLRITPSAVSQRSAKIAMKLEEGSGTAAG